MTLLFTHESSDRHVTPPGHPERVARLEAVRDALAGLALDRRTCPEGVEEDVLRCHTRDHIERIRAMVPAEDAVALDADTFVAPDSLTAAMYAVGGMVAAVDAVMTGDAPNAFVACRPPGHHAERATPMGFCLFGTAAIGAMRALDHHSAARVAVLDFDVHHGNGTQDILWNEPRAMFASSHQMPLYPGTGDASETGAHGNVLNSPLPPLSDGAAARALWRNDILPAVEAFAPELIIISAGFDAAQEDPLANLNWSADDFGAITRDILDVAERVATGRVVSTLEGGYDLRALGAGVRSHVTAMMERSQ